MMGCFVAKESKILQGRMSMIEIEGVFGIVDFAHNPDGLEKALTTIQNLRGDDNVHRIITVFGCEGERDRTKRPKMATIGDSAVP